MGWSLSSYNRCTKCHERGQFDAKFCAQCGGEMEQHQPLPYTSEGPKKGIYRITIVVEREFRNDDHAEECAHKSTLGEEECYFRDMTPDSRIDGAVPVKLEFVRSTVTPETHPYVCRFCRDESTSEHDRSNPPVSATTEGRCEWCDNQDWTLREGAAVESTA